MDELDRLAVATQHCGTCESGPGRRCVTTRGKYADVGGAWASRTHTSRMRALEAAWRVGAQEMAKIIVNIVKYRLDPNKAHVDIYADIEKLLTFLERWA